MWGQALVAFSYILVGRIIPTRVGTRPKKVTKKMVDEDHPHACGDKLYLYHILPKELGSSPRVWGQVCYICRYTIQFRIIPTRVGTSDTRTLCVKKFQDHPHACGDKSSFSEIFQFLLGSSPRVWGQVLNVVQVCHFMRIIPTRVGTRHFPTFRVYYRWDHPHACGDKDFDAALKAGVKGSSPRVWGQDLHRSISCTAGGIIPTRVGTSAGERRL